MLNSKEIEQEATPIWKRYQKSRTLEDRNRLVELYRPLLQILALRIRPPTYSLLDVDDLESAGFIGLLQAIESFDASKQVRFASFADKRIRGSMFDYMRSLDWVPRLDRQRERQGKLIPTQQRRFSEFEISHDADQDFRSTLPVWRDQRAESPSARMENKEWWKTALRTCNRTERLLLILLYQEGLTMKTIGKQLGLSESRISQMHSAMIKRFQDVRIKSKIAVGLRPATERIRLVLPAAASNPDNRIVAAIQFYQNLHPHEVLSSVSGREAEAASWRKYLTMNDACLEQAAA